MTWKDAHSRSEQLAAKAHQLARNGNRSAALKTFQDAAGAEEEALSYLTDSQPRTLGITSVSAVALWLKAREFVKAERLAHQLLMRLQDNGSAAASLRELLQSI